MQISSYTFQSPYPQPFQVGRPDPSVSQQNSDNKTIPETKKETQTTEAKVSPTKDTKVSVSIGALAEGNAQSGVTAFKSLSTSLQAQKTYAQEAVS